MDSLEAGVVSKHGKQSGWFNPLAIPSLACRYLVQLSLSCTPAKELSLGLDQHLITSN